MYIRYLIIVRVLAEEELSALQDGKMARLRDSIQAWPLPDGA